jgi:Tol biopolymer transport system component
MARAASVAAVVITLMASPAHAAFPGRNGRIVFTDAVIPAGSDGFDASGLRTTTFHGGRSRSLRTCRRPYACGHANATYSPTGRRLAFDTGADFYGGDLIVSRADGSARRKLPLPPDHWAEHSAWSPHGDALAFTLWRRIPRGDSDHLQASIFSMSTGGTGLRQVAPDSQDSAWDTDPVWSRRGVLAFQRGFPDSGYDIYVVRPDGSGLRRVTFRGGESPAWSPNGRRLAFTRGHDEVQHLYVLDLVNRRLRRVTQRRAYQPEWSPDGRWIVFVGDETARDYGGLFIVSSRRGRPRQIASDGTRHSYGAPDWQPLPR